MKILFLDIETAPSTVFVWGLFKQNVQLNQIVEPGYTLCWAAKWMDSKEIMFRSVQDGVGVMLQQIYDLLEESDAVVHYNGQKFDIPTLNGEFVKMGLTPPSSYHQIDLLRTARSQFRLTSNKLDFVAQHLGLGSKVKHKGMDLWRECMDGDEKSWRQMERYNKQDVRLLPKLYKRLLPWIKRHPNHALYGDMNRPVCTNCGSGRVLRRGFYNSQTQRYRRYQCKDCGSWMKERFTSLGKDARQNILSSAA